MLYIMEDCKLTGNIIYVTSKERAINYKWEKYADKLSPEVQIVSVNDIQQMDIDIFDDRKLPIINKILVKHPFIPNKYISLDRTEDALTKTKLNCLSSIVRHLGVREYETTYATEETKEVTINANGEIGYNLLNVESKVSINEKDSRTGKYYRHETFKGDFSKKSYKQAVLEAKQYGLYNDEDIYSLIKNRDPKFLNQLTSQHIRIELTRELDEQLDIAFSLKVSNLFKINANYDQIISKRKKIIIETKLLF